MKQSYHFRHPFRCSPGITLLKGESLLAYLSQLSVLNELMGSPSQNRSPSTQSLKA